MRAFDGEVAIAVAQLYLVHMLQRTLPTGFIAPCLPTKTDELPSGGSWLHEIKHDGFRIIARKDGERVRLYSRPGNDFTHRFPLIVETLARLRARSCIIDGEAVACDDSGVASFELIRHDRVCQELAAQLLRFNDLAICPCRRYLNGRHSGHGTLTAKEVFYDTPHPCSAGAGDIHSSVVRPGHHPSDGSIWLYDGHRRQSHCEHVH